MSELGKNLSASRSVFRLLKKTDMPPRFEWRQLRADPPREKIEARASNEPARDLCSRTVAEVRLVGVDSKFSALHTGSNWRGAFEHTNPQAAIMAVLGLVRRLCEQTHGSHESDQKIAATLKDLVAAFKDRKPIGHSPHTAANDSKQTKEHADVLGCDREKAAKAAEGSEAPRTRQLCLMSDVPKPLPRLERPPTVSLPDGQHSGDVDRL